jgi:glycine/D-amino acid oxidase-like deaminating enzyme
VPGGYLACGLTGHGLPYAPVIGLLLAELIEHGRARTLPLEPFDPARYVGVRHEPTWLEPFTGAVPVVL